MTNYGLNDDLLYKELWFDSYDTKKSGGNGDFPHTDWPLFQMPRMLGDVTAMKVLEVQIPFSWYVFNTYNNTFTLLDGVGTATVTIPPANYTSTQMTGSSGVLATALNAASIVAGGSYTYNVTYSTSTMKFTITSNQTSGNFTLNFGAGTVGPDGIPVPEGNFDPSIQLGMNDHNVSTTYNAVGPVLSTIVAPNVSLLSGPSYLYMNSFKYGQLFDAYLPEGAENHGSIGPECAKIPVNVSQDGIINWSDPAPLYAFEIPKQINIAEIDFYLTLGNTNWGWPSNIVPLPLNGLSFSLKLGVWVRRVNHTDFTVGAVSGGVGAVSTPRGVKRPRR